MRILIGIPTYDRRVDIETAQGLLHLEREGYDFDLCFPISSHISRNRNYIVTQFLEGEYDWLLFWDSDLGFEKGFLTKMLETGWKTSSHIIAGCYAMKQDDRKYVLGVKREDGTYENLTAIEKVREVDAAGTGCLLIHRSVFNLLAEPWFTIQDGAALFTLPEDFYFCERAKEKGFKIIADPRFSTRHYGTQPFVHEVRGQKKV